MIKKYKLKNGEERYEFQIYVGKNELTGKEERTTRRGFISKKAAELEQARIKLQISNNEFRKESTETFQDIYESWLLQYEHTVEQSTFIKTTRLFQNHILPYFGNYRVEKITIDICQKSLNEWSNNLKNFKVVKVYASKVFDFAVKRDIIRKNPFDSVELPKVKREPKSNKIEDGNFYSREELKVFLRHLKNETNVKAYTFFRLLAYSGIRKGEALALTWEDIDFELNEIYIFKALSRGKNNKLYIKSTKTNDERVIYMDETTMIELKQWKKVQENQNFKLGIDTLYSKQLVFSNEKNDFIQPSKTRKWIRYVQDKYNLKKVTTHGLRHTHCSLCFESGAYIQEVQNRLGHSDVQTTMNIYTHVSKHTQKETIQKFVDYLDF